MKNTRRIRLNLIVGVGGQFFLLLLGLIVPRIVLTHYGSDTNGLTNTISQIFTYMTLLQAGVSAAANNSLYQPVTEGNRQMISYYMSTARRYYRRISLLYLWIVAGLSVLLPCVLKTGVAAGTIALYVLFEGLASVISFYYINTWKCLLQTSGKSYVVISIDFVTKVLCYLVRIGLALQNYNIALIQIGYFAVSLIQLRIYAGYMKKKYGWIDYAAAPATAKLPDRNSYVITELAWTVFSSTDMIILSIFVSTAMSSVYSVYNMVFIAISGLLNAAYSSIQYNLGQAYVKDLEKYKKVHDLYHSAFMAAVTVLMCVTYFLMIPFIRLYTRGVSDINYIYRLLPLLFCLIQMLSWSRYVAGNLSGIAGYAKQVSYVSLAEAAINLIASVLLVRKYGITGVLLATVMALPLKVVYLNWLAEKKIMQRKATKTIGTIGLNFLVFLITVLLEDKISLQIESYTAFFAWGVVLTVLYGGIVWGLNSILNHDLCKRMVPANGEAK